MRKTAKRVKLGLNKLQGRVAEVSYAAGQINAGKNIKRTGRGSDFKVDGKLVEVKSSSKARLSKLQKETQKKNKGKYKVKRIGV